MNYKDLQKKAGWFKFFNKADDELGKVHDKEPQPTTISSWDPEMTDQSGTEFQFDSSGIEKKIYGDLKKHYAKMLANAYFKSTGKHLADPESKIDPRYQYILGHAGNVDPEVMKKLTKYYQDNIGGWNSYTPEMSPDLIADAVDYVNNRRSWVPLMKGPEDTKEMAFTKRLPADADLDLALLNRKKASYQEFRKVAEDIEEAGDDIDWNEVARQIQEYRDKNELGTWGAFKKSLPVSLLIAGLSGVLTGAASGSVGLGAAVGGLSGAATAGLNVMNNRHALPEEAGTSFLAVF